MSLFKEYEGKQVKVFWKDGRETYEYVTAVNGAFVNLSSNTNFTSGHLIDDMEILENPMVVDADFEISIEKFGVIKYGVITEKTVFDLKDGTAYTFTDDAIHVDTAQPLAVKNLNSQADFDRVDALCTKNSVENGFLNDSVKILKEMVGEINVDKQISDALTHGVSVSIISEEGVKHVPALDVFSVIGDEESKIDRPNSVGEVITFSQEYFNSIKEECIAKDKPKRKQKPKKLPRAYQRYSEGGIWYVHFGNGRGFMVKGKGETLEQAYFDWKQKHEFMQSKTRNGGKSCRA